MFGALYMYITAFDIKNKAENIVVLVCFHFVSDMSVLSLLLSILLNLIGKLW